MLSYEEIMNYCSNYKIENGIVIDKSTNQQILDEDFILKVKSSVLLFRESKDAYQSDIQQFGKTSKSQEEYIKKTMEKFSVNNEQSTFGINKLINAILNSKGHYEEFMSGKDLNNSKFSILVPPKSEYGTAYLKMKFREKGLDIDDLKISQDLSELQHNGVSKVVIDFKLKKYEKTEQKSQSIEPQKQHSSIQHPRANELNELEKQKQIAKQNGDEVAYNYAQSSIEKIIRETKFEVTQQQWDSMGINDKISFINIKINESKILHDQDAFNFWNSNLKSLNEKLSEQSEVKEYHQPIYNSAPTSDSNSKDYQEMIQELGTTKDCNYYFDEMLKATQQYNPSIQMTEEQKKQLIGEIFYNEGYLIDSLSNDEELRQIMTRSVNELSNNEMQNKLQNIILTEIQEKYKQLHPQIVSETNKNSSDVSSNNSTIIDESEYVNNMIFEMNKKYQKIEARYFEMMEDNELDYDEASELIHSLNKLVDEMRTSKGKVTDSLLRNKINIVINNIEEVEKNIKVTKNNLEEFERAGRSL